MLAWLRKKSPAAKHLGVDSYAEYFIGAEVTMQGKLSASTDIFIDGRVSGELETTGLIELGKNSQIEANITARTALFEGTFSGSASLAEEAVIRSCAQVSGQIESGNIQIERGALVNAKIKVRTK